MPGSIARQTCPDTASHLPRKQTLLQAPGRSESPNTHTFRDDMPQITQNTLMNPLPTLSLADVFIASFFFPFWGSKHYFKTQKSSRAGINVSPGLKTVVRLFPSPSPPQPPHSDRPPPAPAPRVPARSLLLSPPASLSTSIALGWPSPATFPPLPGACLARRPTHSPGPRADPLA